MKQCKQTIDDMCLKSGLDRASLARESGLDIRYIQWVDAGDAIRGATWMILCKWYEEHARYAPYKATKLVHDSLLKVAKR